jgi:allantoinase
MTVDLAIRAERMITPEGERSGWVTVSGGRITAIEPLTAPMTATATVELGGDEVLLPGLVDSHVHVNDPGRAEWEGFGTATRAAAAGGITTIIDMPLNSIPPTTDLAALAAKKTATTGRIHVDVGFWGGAVGTNTTDLATLHEAGVFGFKSFLLHSGVDEFGHLGEEHLAEVVERLAALDALLIVHAEDAHTIDTAPQPAGPRYADFLASRPRAAENLAIARVLDLAERFGARVHILHLSSADALPMLARARERGVRVTVETCPHYLSFCAEEIPDGATEFKCCPPVREAENRERLWQGLRDGVIDCIVSDHSPCTAELKRFDVGDFGLAWGGIASVQLGLSAIWTQARARRIELADVVTWMARRPADLVGLSGKGRIEPGGDADFAVFAPDDAFVVDPARLHHRNPVTAYRGRPLAGVVRGTWLRGRKISGTETKVTDAEPSGTLLRRESA